MNPAVKITEMSAVQSKLVHGYGLFMVAWSVLESIIQTAIMIQLEVSPEKAVIVTGKLQFHPRAQLLISLLKQKASPNEEAIKLLNKMEGFAKRNTLVHGLIVIGNPNTLRFVKFDGNASVSQSFDPREMQKHLFGLADRTSRLQELLEVSDEDLQRIGDATIRFCKAS